MEYPHPIQPQPATPVNGGNSPHSPRAPIRHRADVQRHPSTPLPPSASNFLDQNNFPSDFLQSPHLISHRERPHTFPSHYHRYPQPRFVQPPPPQFYSSQRPYEHQYFSQPQYFYPPHFTSHNVNNVPLPLPSHNHNTVPLPLHNNINTVPLPTIPLPTSSVTVPSTTSTVPKPLPSITHIPILSGWSDFSAWSNGVRSLILYLGLAGHIANQPAPGIAPRPDRVPSYPPTLSTVASAAELATSRAWWEEDNIVSHILTSRLTPSVLAILLFDDDDESIAPRTARAVYTLLRQLYSVHDHTSSSALYAELCNLMCGGRVLDYVTRWRAGIIQLRAARFTISFRMVIERFLDCLPTSVPYDILRFRTMETINDIGVDDVTAFIKLTDEVLKIDNTYRRTRPTTTRSSNPAPRIPPPPTSSSIINVPKPSTQPARSSLICSNTNCGAIGHTIDTCFKIGGGLEGKREQYLASWTCVQAHLAHLIDVLDGNSIDEPDPPSSTPDNSPDIITEPEVGPPSIAALSLDPAITSPPVVVDTTFVNEDFYFEQYFLGDREKSYAMSALPLDMILSDLRSPSVPTALTASPFPFNSLLDSGCTNHIFRDRSVFWTYDSSLATPVKMANCGFLNTLARGSVRFRVKTGNRMAVFVLKDCLHAPDAPLNLISVGAMTEKGATFTFAPGLTSIAFPTTPPSSSPFSFNATVLHRLSFLDCDFVLPPPSTDPLPSPVIQDHDTALLASFPVVPLTPDLWHRRFGHLGCAATHAALTKNYATGIVYEGSFDKLHCIPCLIGKQPQQPFSHHGHRGTIIDELLHVDICGPFPTLTSQKYNSFIGILDDYSNFGHVGLLRKRSDAFQFYTHTEAQLELVSGSCIITVRMDGAPELCEGQLGAHIRNRGITIQVTAPYAHQQNGKAERYIRTLEDDMQTLLADSGLPFSFWGWAVLTAQYLRNRLPTSVLPSDTTPYERYRKTKPDLSHLRVWGCQCFVLIPPELRTKGGPRRFEGIFVGYDDHRVGWYVCDKKNAVHFSRDVIFNESVPGRLSSTSTSIPSSNSSSVVSSHPVRSRTRTEAGQAYAETIAARDRSLALRRSRTSSDETARPPLSLSAVLDFVSLVDLESFSSSISTWSLADQTSYIFSYFCLFSHVDPDRYLRAPRFDLSRPPESYHEACARTDAHVWRAAMGRELDSLNDRPAFAPADLPAGRKAIGVRWVYAYKYNPDGSIIKGKEKARLVAQGFSQRPEDFDDTYAPVAKMTSIRIILAFAAATDLEIMASDVKTAFLHCKLQKELYCKQIPGYPLDDSKKVLRLLVALYGLRQSAFEFYTLLRKCFASLGMHRCDVDHAVFSGTWVVPPHPSIPALSSGAPLFAIIPVHVDDGLIVCNSLPLYTWIINELQKSLEIVDMGPASLYLGNRITRDRSCRKLWLSQKSYCLDLLRTWNLSNCTPASTPMTTKLCLLDPAPNALPEIADDDIKPLFQRLVGSLIYLAICMRPDISYAAMSLGQYNANPSRAHLVATKHVLRYLAGTVDFALEFNFDGGVVPATIGGFLRNCAISDADWASDESDRKSISGYCFYFMNSLVSWSAVKQKAISLLSTEAEYYSMTHAVKEALWIRLFLTLHSFPFPQPFPLLSDNQSACALANNSSITSRSKHIDVRHHFIRAHISDGIFCTNWIPTSDMPANIFTRPLPYPLFAKHRSSLGLTVLS